MTETTGAISNATNEPQKQEEFMLSNQCYQLLMDNKYVLRVNNVMDGGETDLTENLSFYLSYWYVLQSTTSNKFTLYNKSIKRVLSNQRGSFGNKLVDIGDIKKNTLVTIEDSNLWIPEIIPTGQITLKSVTENDKYLSSNGKKLYFNFILDNEFIDFPGNCNINNIELKNVNCIYFSIDSSKYCFRRSSDYVYLNAMGSKYYFEYDNDIIKTTTKKDIDKQKWYIWIDNFNRILLQPFMANKIIDANNNNISIVDLNKLIHEYNIFISEENDSGYYLQPFNNTQLYLQPLSYDIDNSELGLSTTKTKICFNTKSKEKSLINEISFPTITHGKIPNIRIRNSVINNPLVINDYKFDCMSDRIEIINNSANIYKPKEVTNSIYSSKLTENYFKNITENNSCYFEYTNQNLIDMVNLIIKDGTNEISNDDLKIPEEDLILPLILDLYKKLNVNPEGSNSSVVISSKDSLIVGNSNEFTEAIGWNKYFLLPDNDYINGSPIQEGLNYMLTKLNVFMVHFLDNIFYGDNYDLENDFISIFTHDNKLLSVSVISNLLQSLFKYVNNNPDSFSLKTLIPTFDMNNEHSKQGGIAYWVNENGYWNDIETSINYSIIETSNSINSQWDFK